MAKAHKRLIIARWLKPTAIKDNPTAFLFIAVPFMGRIIKVFAGFSQKIFFRTPVVII
ncbi:hypothetical protein [Mucilaginibacter sp. RCC_168]|uniref:hypothetical protein n=1 Tax=Mucilaginibacter sp. RCC_168 TaxID=3239221 RepID=UPI003523BE25